MRKFFSLSILFLLIGCASNESIISNIDEREANEIVVYLASKGIAAQKIAAPTEVGGAGPANLFNITVASDQATDAMSYLNRVGFPRVQGTNLLTLFAKSGLMSSDREELIRYQAGLAEELKNTILKIDGIIDAHVQISFPPMEASALPTVAPPKITAAVYVKHIGLFEDPNMHLETKIKRLVSSAISGVDFDDVTVITDRSKMADIRLAQTGEPVGIRSLDEHYVSIWSIVMTKSSLTRFRFLFFSLILLNLLFAVGLGWLIYRFYPELLKSKKGKETPPAPPGE